MDVSHAGGPWGFTFGTRLGPIFWAHENIGCYVPKEHRTQPRLVYQDFR